MEKSKEKITIEIEAEYLNAIEALKEKGFKYEIEDNKFIKEDKAYEFSSMNHFNTLIYDITLKKVDNIIG